MPKSLPTLLHTKGLKFVSLAVIAVAMATAPALAAGPKAFGKSTSEAIDDFTTSTFTPILSKTFRAPAKGVIMIVASVNAEDDVSLSGPGRLVLNLKLDSKEVWEDDFAFEISTSDDVSVKGHTGTMTAVLPVSAGNHTVSILAREASLGTFVMSRSLSIVYFPNGKGFSIPVPESLLAKGRLNQ